MNDATSTRTMNPNQAELIPTRASLLKRLSDWQDHSSWQDFFNVYWKLIYGVARKAGLSDAEAQDVVQETLLSVAKQMPTFKYDPSIGSFKAWLLNLTRWRIITQFRKRKPAADHLPPAATSTARTDPVDRLPDPNAANLDAVWESEWETNILEAALDRVRHKLDPIKFQVFDFYVRKEWAPEKVAECFSISVGQVYQIKHRVTAVLRAEVQRLEKEMT
jgi:RNA polymerase sigma-70 factor (ECF subfamily)